MITVKNGGKAMIFSLVNRELVRSMCETCHTQQSDSGSVVRDYGHISKGWWHKSRFDHYIL